MGASTDKFFDVCSKWKAIGCQLFEWAICGRKALLRCLVPLVEGRVYRCWARVWVWVEEEFHKGAPIALNVYENRPRSTYPANQANNARLAEPNCDPHNDRRFYTWRYRLE